MNKIFLLVLLTLLPFAPLVSAAEGPSTNATVTVYDQDGHGVNIPVPDSLQALAAKYGGWLTCIAFVANIILRFVPKAQPGTWEAFAIWFLKFVKTSTPEKHIADVPLQPTASAPPPDVPITTNFHG